MQDEPRQGGFAAARLADYAEGLAFPLPEAYVAHRLDVATAFEREMLAHAMDDQQLSTRHGSGFQQAAVPESVEMKTGNSARQRSSPRLQRSAKLQPAPRAPGGGT